MLLSNIIPGFSLAEAKDSIMEYEQFKTAMEVCRCVVILYCVEMLRPVYATLLGLKHCSMCCWACNIGQCVVRPATLLNVLLNLHCSMCHDVGFIRRQRRIVTSHGQHV
jgi:hypothetical protein